MSIQTLILLYKQIARTATTMATTTTTKKPTPKCTITHQIYIMRQLKSSAKQTHPSADRNSQPIGEALCAQIDRKTPNLQMLEISSGSGQHAGYLAPLLPNITIQPTEFERYHFRSINAYAADCTTKNIRKALFVDISHDYEDWEAETKAVVHRNGYDYMYNSNMMHISPWACSVGLFRAAGQLLKSGGVMYTYGPYASDGVLTPESNVNFDASLRSRNPEWGVRDIVQLKELAQANGLKLHRIVEMPSNNKFLTWQKL